MNARPRVLLLERGDGAGHAWPDILFAELARDLAAADFEVTHSFLAPGGARWRRLCPGADAPVTDEVGPPGVPLVCGRGRALETAALRDAYAVAQRFELRDFDAILAPLRGGAAQGLLMRRATEMPPRPPAVALWGDAPSRSRALAEDHCPPDVSPLVCDALERACLRLADLLLVPGAPAARRVESLAEPLPPIRDATLPPFELAGRRVPKGAAPIRELVLVGPLTRANGALLFLDAVEELGRTGALRDRAVTFLGPAAAHPRGIGQPLLGIRAAAWPFRFQLLDGGGGAAATLAYLSVPGRLAVFAAEDGEDDRLLRTLAASGCALIATGGYEATRAPGAAQQVCAPTAPALADAILRALDSGGGTAPVERTPTDWPALLREICRMPRRAAAGGRDPPRRASICIVHRDRPECLRRALASIPPALGAASAEVIVADNAGAVPPSVEALPACAQLSARVVRLARPLPQQAAINKIALDAEGDILVFLDDDNVLEAGAVERLLRGFASGAFDIVVSTLDLVDGDPAVDLSSGRFVFLGDAGMAGLFFNGFGDTAMAVKRHDFLRIGGFSDPGYGTAALDWVFLAKARAAGLRIGVLHEPAIRYARTPGAESRQWRKHDAEGARRAVAAAYGAALDAPLLARFGQAMQLDLP
jgi:hypothetical protein